MTSILYLERFCTSCKRRKSLVGGTSFPRFRCKECRNAKRNTVSNDAHSHSRPDRVLVSEGLPNRKQ